MKKFLALSLALLAGCLIAAEIQLYPMAKPNKYISGFALHKDAQYYWFMFQLTPEAPQDLVIDRLYVNTDKDKNTGRTKVGNEYYVVAAKNSITAYTREGKEIGGRKKVYSFRTPGWQMIRVNADAFTANPITDYCFIWWRNKVVNGSVLIAPEKKFTTAELPPLPELPVKAAKKK